VTIRVVIADDQPVVRAGFSAMLSAQPDLEVVGEAADGAELVELVLRSAPDVAVVDVRMPHVDGIEAVRRLQDRGSATRVLVVTTFDLGEYVYQALRAGASGFLLKDSPVDRLVEGVRMVSEGAMLLGPSVTRRLIEELGSGRRPVAHKQIRRLTRTEYEVAVLVAQGLSNAEIAEHRQVSEQTVKSHVSEILRRLEVRDRVQVVVIAYEAGMVTPAAGTTGGTEADLTHTEVATRSSP